VEDRAVAGAVPCEEDARVGGNSHVMMGDESRLHSYGARNPVRDA
jgi:hypothetical protein